jgi:hypothetical protein
MAFLTSGASFFSNTQVSNTVIGTSAFILDTELGAITVASQPVIGTTAGMFYAATQNLPGVTNYPVDIHRYLFSADSSQTVPAGPGAETKVCGATQNEEFAVCFVDGYYPVSRTAAKYKFASSVTGYALGDVLPYYNQGTLSGAVSSPVAGYVAGGEDRGAPAPPFPAKTDILKYVFAYEHVVSKVGDLLESKLSSAGISGSIAGYWVGGYPRGYAPTPTMPSMQKFPFASENSVTYSGTTGASGAFVNASQQSGYQTGGENYAGGLPTTIRKFPFASDGNMTSVGNISVSRYGNAQGNSTTAGYICGGMNNPVYGYNITTNARDKFPFANEAAAASIGTLYQPNQGSCGTSD